DVNLKGAYLCSKEVATIMLGQEAGKIIMMSSNSGLYHPSAMKFTEYVVSKAGMNGLTKALALALGPHITVNAICPGWIKTDMIADTDPEVEQRILAETALSRWGTTDDVTVDDADVVRVRSGGAFADGPNWFVGDDNTATIWDWHQAQSCPSLANHVVERQRRAAWLELSHAHDRCHIVAKDLTHLERHDLI